MITLREKYMYNNIQKWGGLLLSAGLMPTDLPLIIKIILAIIAGLSGIINILNGADKVVENAPKWRVFWLGWGVEIKQFLFRYINYKRIKRESKKRNSNNTPI